MQCFFEKWWVQGVIFPIATGVPLSIWTAFIVSRYLDFKTVIRDATFDLFHFRFIADSPEEFASNNLDRNQRAMRHFTTLTHGGQIDASVVITNEFSKVQTLEETLRNQLVQGDLRHANQLLKNYAADTSKAMGRMFAQKPEIIALLFGAWVAHHLRNKHRYKS
jgi:hypothetical protein